MASPRKNQANRKNAQQSTGPKTAGGKNIAKRNAFKHGFYTRELILTDEQVEELQQLREHLRSEFRPTTPLQELAFEEIVCCAWRCRMAIRLEMTRVIAFEKMEDRVEPELALATGTALELEHWYGAGRQELRAATSFLKSLREGYLHLGRIPEDLREQLIRGFGPGFYEMLTEWIPPNIDAAIGAKFWADKGEFLGQDPSDSRREGVVLDPFQSQQMVTKLIDQQVMHLEAMARSFDLRSSLANQQQRAIEFAPRYFTTATRDLHRAVEWFTHLKEQKL